MEGRRGNGGDDVKIAYILNTYPQPSQSFIRRELKGLERLGHDITRIAMRRSALPLVDPADRAEEARTRHVLEAGGPALLGAVLRCLATRPGAFARALRLALRMGAAAPRARLRHLIYLVEACQVLRLVEAAGCAHMHAHFGTNAAAVAALVDALGGPGYSFTVHGPEEFDAPKALSLPLKMARARFVVAVSSFGRSQLCRWLPHEQWERVKVVHCGIDPADFPAPAPLPAPPPGGGVSLVTIGRLSEQKGQLILPPVIAALRARLPGLRLTIVGDGDLRRPLEARIAELGLAGSVTLTGWLAEREVRAALREAQALILPSFAEGLPMVVMEAMASGRPVIATHIAGIPELVEDGVTGWLVPAGDGAALEEAVIALATATPAERAEMGRAAWQRVMARHDMYREAGRLARLFDEAVTAESREEAPERVPR